MWIKKTQCCYVCNKYFIFMEHKYEIITTKSIYEDKTSPDRVVIPGNKCLL